jgi:hypothetical protein
MALNVTVLVHYTFPAFFSTFCRVAYTFRKKKHENIWNPLILPETNFDFNKICNSVIAHSIGF